MQACTRTLFHICAVFMLVFSTTDASNGQIDRKKIIDRNHVVVTSFDTLASLSVGNGEFLLTVDATGLQTFPEYYKNGIPLGTESQWGWHSFPNVNAFEYSETLSEFDFAGKMVSYPYQSTSPERKRDAAEWFRQNPHRLHLGQIGLEYLSTSGKPLSISDITEIHQELDLWSGEITSRFRIDGERVEVHTVCHQEKDLVAGAVISPLLKDGRLKVTFRFPYPTGAHSDWACDFDKPLAHQTVAVPGQRSTTLLRTIDDTRYNVTIAWEGDATFFEKEKHCYLLSSANGSDHLEFSVLFDQHLATSPLPSFRMSEKNSRDSWKSFWMSGGAVDFSECTDPRAHELERRVVLSQYLTKIQCAGSRPPQETGLTYNSWYGKFHLEMHWWHAVHFALWNRLEHLEKSLDWYSSVLSRARETAERQGYAGARWPKMVGPEGLDSPSKVGPFLIWQQPHLIYFAELCYRARPNAKTLLKYKDLVFATAEFMVSFARYDSTGRRYVLGPGIIAAQERFDPETTFNTPLELSYWKWGLDAANKWRERMGLPLEKKWKEVSDKLSSLPQKDGLYLSAESAPESYTEPRRMSDHPAVLGAYGMLSGSGVVDTSTMRRTFDYIWNHWNWEETWGWDFPLTAMTATRLHDPSRALDALFMTKRANTYLPNGHNYQNDRLRLYLPGNGGLLSAIAMMCAGYEGNPVVNPGFPKNGRWNVKWEKLLPLF